MGIIIKKYSGKTLSCLRTYNEAPFYCEIKTPDDAVEAFKYAASHKLTPFVLGGGSNVFFKRTKIKSMILKVAMPKTLVQSETAADEFEVSASVKMLDMLGKLYSDSRDAPYYLASAPCEIGGALAMNAGSGPKEGLSISDFLLSLTYADENGIHTAKKKDIAFSYRHSPFADGRAMIVSAVFSFSKKNFSENPIKARLEWAKKNQDLSAPNCGSLCNKYYAPILKIARTVFAPFRAGISQKKLNWAYNKANSPFTLRACLGLITILHKLLQKPLKFEIKFVD